MPLKKAVSKLLILVALFSFWACNRQLVNKYLDTTVTLNREELLGKYRWKSIPGVASRLELLENKRFKYFWKQGLFFGNSEGTWELEHNMILLNSDIQPNTLKGSRLDELPSKDIKGIEFKVLDKDKQPMQYVNCAVYHRGHLIDGCITDSLGNCRIEGVTAFEKVEITSLGLAPLEFSTKKIKSNSLLIYVDESEVGYEIFTNKKWFFEEGKIIMPEMKEDEFTKKYFERVE